MKKGLFLLIALMMLWLPTAGLSEDALLMSLAEPVEAGAQEIRLNLAEGLIAQKVNVFSGEMSIADSAFSGEREVTVVLSRGLIPGEELTILAEAEGDDPGQELRMEVRVPNPFTDRLSMLRNRANETWTLWKEEWVPLSMTEGKVYLPEHMRYFPFLIFPDEAPEIFVRESEGTVRVYLSDADCAGWRVCLGGGVPVEYTDCVWDETGKAWTGSGDYDAVYLISDMTENAPSISICYQKENGFRASYPVLEWMGEMDGSLLAMNCYGWGTARSFDGGMYCFVMNEHTWYAEYAADRTLVSWWNEFDSIYDAEGNLLSGQEPEGYVNPVVTAP